MKKIILIILSLTTLLFSCSNGPEKKVNKGYYNVKIYVIKNIQVINEGLIVCGISEAIFKDGTSQINMYMNFSKSYENTYSLSTANIDEDEIPYIMDFIDACDGYQISVNPNEVKEIRYNLVNQQGGFAYLLNTLCFADANNVRYQVNVTLNEFRNIVANAQAKIIQLKNKQKN